MRRARREAQDEDAAREMLEKQSQASLWLARGTFLLTALLFASLVLSLVLIDYYNTKHRGFAIITENHYSWTYGPTAVLVLIVALWRQIDYHCKAAIPWLTLGQGRASASQSLLLDYVSPLQVVSLWRSLKNGHLLVAWTTIGFVLLKLATLASTGLLAEEVAVLPRISTMAPASTRFNGSLYNETDYISKSGSSYVYTAYSIMAKGLKAPKGTTDKLVYESFDVPSEFSSDVGYIRAQVHALVSSFNCEAAGVSVNPYPYKTDGTQIFDSIVMDSPRCEILGGTTPPLVLNPKTQTCPPRQLRGIMVAVNCSEDADAGRFSNWQLLTLVEALYINQTVNDSADSTPSGGQNASDVFPSVEIKKATGLLCRPSYRIADVSLAYNLSHAEQDVVVGDPGTGNGTLSGFDDEDLTLTFRAALNDASTMFGLQTDSQLEEEFPDPLFKLMAAASGGRYENLLDQQAMAAAAETTFQHIAVQVVNDILMDNSSMALAAEVSIQQKRLLVSPIPFWIMVSSFIALTILSAWLTWTRPPAAPPPRANTVLGVGQVLIHSHALQAVVQELQDSPEKRVAQRLQDYVFSLSRPDTREERSGFAIVPIPKAERPPPAAEHRSEAETKPFVFWRPFTTRTWVMVASLALPLVAIVLLEVLQRNSDRNGGILTLSAMDGSGVTVYTRLIPALVMLMIATSFNAVDFNVSLLAPFNAMRRKPAPAERSIEACLVDKIPPLVLWNTAKHRHYAALFSAIAALVGSGLTIVASGLYTVESYPSSAQLHLRSLDAFNTTWPGSATNDDTAAVLTSLTEGLNLTYPAFTYEELALPAVTAVSPVDNSSSQPQLQLKYPALRASLNCTALDASQYNVTPFYNSRITSASATIAATMPLPPSCPFGGPGGNLSVIDVRYGANIGANISYMGKLLDLHVGPYDAIEGSSFGETEPSAQNDNPPGCPSLAFIYGFVNVEVPEQTEVTVLMCYQQIQRVQTTVFFDLPAMTISTAQAPIPNERTIELLPNGPDGETTFSYRIQQHTDKSLSIFNQTTYASDNLANTPVDGFFQGVLFGRTPLPETMLRDRSNQDTMVRGINAFYRRYMAQAISANMRVPLNSTDAGSQASSAGDYEGTVLNASQTARLVQHRTAKLILQILLGLMLILGAVGWGMTRLRDLVPFNPCTIFGMAALLAGSKMCAAANITDAAPSDKSQTRVVSETLSCRRYQLGWWDDTSGGREDQAQADTEADAISREREGLRHRKRYGVDFVEFRIGDS